MNIYERDNISIRFFVQRIIKLHNLFKMRYALLSGYSNYDSHRIMREVAKSHAAYSTSIKTIVKSWTLAKENINLAICTSVIKNVCGGV